MAEKKTGKARAVKQRAAKTPAPARKPVKKPVLAAPDSKPARRGSPRRVAAAVAPPPPRARRAPAVVPVPAPALVEAALEPATPAGRPPRRPARPRVRRAAAAAPAAAPVEAAFEPAPRALTDEERIESSKYDVRERPRRVFEEERFLFPETYESDRVRLLVKDPEWLFAHWDVSPVSLQRLRDDIGERASALSRLTLRLEDPSESALSVVLLPDGARSWYVRTHAAHRAYRAALGVTTPSGEFRTLATSNVVVAPRGGPSPQRARRRVGFSRSQATQAAVELERTGTLAASVAERGTPARAAEAGVAEPGSVDYIDAAVAGSRPAPSDEERAELGGASDLFVPGGASDVFRR